MMRFLALSLLAGTAVALDASKVEMLLSTLWAQTDVQPQDGSLSYQEFVNAANTLGLDPNILTSHQKSLQVFYNDLDANSDGLLTTSELVNGALDHADYAVPLLNLFTNNAGSIPTDIITAPDSDVAAAGESC